MHFPKIKILIESIFLNENASVDPDEKAHMSRVVFPRSSAFQKLFAGPLSSLLQETGFPRKFKITIP